MSTIGMLSVPVGPSSAAAWPLSLQLTRWPVRSRWQVLIWCSLASLSSTDSVASRSFICCSLAYLSSADSVASQSLICCSLASLSSVDLVASRSLFCCSLASLSSADSVASRSRLCCRSDFVRQYEQRAQLCPSFFVYSAVPPFVPLSLSHGGPSLAPAFVEGVSLVCDSRVRGVEARC